ncbi:MAG: hypothetical protein CUN57_02225, partial [Phototrophicales bacterium]
LTFDHNKLIRFRTIAMIKVGLFFADDVTRRIVMPLSFYRTFAKVGQTTIVQMNVYQHFRWKLMNDITPCVGQVQPIQERAFVLWHKTEFCQSNSLHIPSTLFCGVGQSRWGIQQGIM